MELTKAEIKRLKSEIQANKNEDEVIKLLERFDTEIMLVEGTALNHAVNYQREGIVRKLIERGANVNALYDGDYTPLMSTVERQNKVLIKLILEQNVDIDYTDRYGNNALMKAVNTFDLDIVKLIVEAGGDPFTSKNKVNYSAYNAAVDMGASEIVKYFEELKR